MSFTQLIDGISFVFNRATLKASVLQVNAFIQQAAWYKASVEETAQREGRGDRLRSWQRGMGGKGEMLTCFSPSILLSACWTASRYLKCNSISRSTWRKNEIETGREKVRDGAHETATRKWGKYEGERPEHKEETEQDETRRANMKKCSYYSFSARLSFLDSFNCLLLTS